jgi:hypothetical protein
MTVLCDAYLSKINASHIWHMAEGVDRGEDIMDPRSLKNSTLFIALHRNFFSYISPRLSNNNNNVMSNTMIILFMEQI